MGLFRGLAYMLDPKMAQEADRRQAEYNRAMGIDSYGGGAGVVGSILANWRASRAGPRYWQDHNAIQQAMNPHNDPQHVPGCTCRFCFRGRIEDGRDRA